MPMSPRTGVAGSEGCSSGCSSAQPRKPLAMPSLLQSFGDARGYYRSWQQTRGSVLGTSALEETFQEAEFPQLAGTRRWGSVIARRSAFDPLLTFANVSNRVPQIRTYFCEME